MKTKSAPLQRDECVSSGTAHCTESAHTRREQRAPSSSKFAPLLARRVPTGLLQRMPFQRMPSFARSVTDARSSHSFSSSSGSKSSSPRVSDSDASSQERTPPEECHGLRASAAPAVDGRGPLPSRSDDVAGDAGVAASALAREVGQNAQEYLEECFDDATSVLARETFDAIPEIDTAALTLADHIGKGSYCDVFDVVRKASPSARRKTSTTFALKRLRPQLRYDADKYMMGAEDLVHETAILAHLDHRHIVKLHGRAGGPLADAFASVGGYFILLEKLSETLPERLAAWKRTDGVVRGLRADRRDVARAVAAATAYLHSKDIVVRDLKPDNVGFDRAGVPKLFDFGFALGVPTPDAGNPAGLLYDRCGTPRYMAPEVGLSRGYGAPADVYSFGVLLWTLCAMETPFAAIRSHDEFERTVFLGGHRPMLGEQWSTETKELIGGCWAAAPSDRPTMATVESLLASG